MTTPRDPRDPRDDGLPDDIANRLRASLERHAVEAPDGGIVAERILHAADRTTARPRRRQVPWAPSLAAAAVLIVIAGVILAITRVGSTGGSNTAAASSDRTASAAAATPSAGPTHAAPQVERPATSSASSSSTTGATPLTNVRLVDLTFNGLDSGWALGSADCLNGSGKRCTALLHTSNGRTWTSRGGEQFNVPGVNGCATACVTQIRFANANDGYAFGPGAFFMTTDGGANWVQQGTGGALALETLDGNVVRVSSSHSGCPGPCDVRVETSAIGATTWTTRDIGRPADAANDAVSLARGGSDVYVLFTGHVAGGADSATSTLYRSDDDGTTWQSSGEVCRQGGGSDGEVDSHAVAAATNGRVAVLCTTREGQQTSVATSTDHGETFRTSTGTVPAATASLLTGAADTVLVTAGTGLARSTDGGGSWTTSTEVTGKVRFVGFESTTVGRALADGGRTIWTTRNGGQTWTRVSLG